MALLLFLLVSPLIAIGIYLAVSIKKRPSKDYSCKVALKDALKVKFAKYNIPKKCLITGGSGFLGRHLADALVEQGCDVTIFDLRKATNDDRQKFVKGNLVDPESVRNAFKGMECIFHCASPHPNGTNKQVFYDVNVKGTQNVIDACLSEGVQRLVFTSSASVVYNGSDQVNGDESLPYPAVFRDPYCESKAQAEQLVLEAGKKHSDKLSTVTLRPHGLFGSRDLQLVPTLVQQARAGRMGNTIGDGNNLVDFTYIGNVVLSHLLGAQAATLGAPCSGEAYFITNNEPIPFWDFMSFILVGLGYAPPSKCLPYKFILGLSYVAQGVVSLLAPIKRIPLTFSPSRMQLAGTHHYYNSAKAKRDLGYEPLWTVQQGLALTLKAYEKTEWNPKSPRPKQSIVDHSTLGVVTAAEVRKHNTADDLWIIVKGVAYDVTSYVNAHPGDMAILNRPGLDNTEGFFGKQHPDTTYAVLQEFAIARVEG